MSSPKNTKTASNSITPNSAAAEIIANTEDLLTEILLRLPIKSLIKFKSVSKHWLSLITNPQFSSRRSSSLSSASGLFLKRTRFHSPQTRHLQFDTIDLNSLHSTPPLRSFPFLHADSPSTIKILQSCNGLLLCSTSHSQQETENYFVYNPTTKHYTNLPSLPSHNGLHCLALAFDPSLSSHYKVICVTNSNTLDRSLLHVMIYSSDAGPWRWSRASIAVDFDTRFDRGGLFANGSVHWLNAWGLTAPYFNVDEERLGQMPMPPVPDHLEAVDRSFGYFGESRGYLHFVDHAAEQGVSSFRVLQLERDYSGWFVKFRVEVSEICKAFPEMIPSYLGVLGRELTMNDYYLSVICVVRCEEEEDSYLVMNLPGKVLRYNFKSGSFYKVCDVEPFQYIIDDYEIHDMVLEPWDAFQYIESLACV